MPSTLKKAIFITVILLSYFLIFRDLRKELINIQLSSIRQTLEENEEVDYQVEGTSIWYIVSNLKKDQIWTYKITFGFFFLLVLILLIGFDANRSAYLYLIIFHLLSGVIATLFMWMGLTFNVFFLVVSDILTRYLIPVFSFALGALAYLQKKEKLSDEI